MKSRFFACLAICLLLISCTETMSITGRLRMAGNVPFQYLEIVGDSLSARLPDTETATYQHLQNKKVRVVGRVQPVELETVDGKHMMKFYVIEPDSVIFLTDL